MQHYSIDSQGPSRLGFLRVNRYSSTFNCVTFLYPFRILVPIFSSPSRISRNSWSTSLSRQHELSTSFYQLRCAGKLLPRSQLGSKLCLRVYRLYARLLSPCQSNERRYYSSAAVSADRSLPPCCYPDCCQTRPKCTGKGSVLIRLGEGQDWFLNVQWWRDVHSVLEDWCVNILLCTAVVLYRTSCGVGDRAICFFSSVSFFFRDIFCGRRLHAACQYYSVFTKYEAFSLLRRVQYASVGLERAGHHILLIITQQCSIVQQ